MKKLYFIFLFISLYIQAQVPAYYQGIDFTNTASQIKDDLNFLLRNTHSTKLSYTPGVWNALKQIDLDPDNADKVLLVYGYNDYDNDPINDRTRGKDLTCHAATCSQPRWNREHIYPKSIGEFESDGFEITDIHAIRASDTNMNNYRYNSPYVDGEGDSGEINPYRFYPGDEWKGDVARMILYMYLRYPSNCKPKYVGIDAHIYNQEIPDIFLEWNAEDPVSEFEMIRNNKVEQIQGNRNPFIDNPYIATLLWGGPKAEDLWGTLSTQDLEIELNTFDFYPNPTKQIIYYNLEDFSSIYIYDETGKLVGKDSSLNNKQTTLPQPKGLYLVEFCKKNSCKTVKVIKN